MGNPTHARREELAAIQEREGLVDLLVSQVDQAYVTAGAPQALARVRDLFRALDDDTLRSLVYRQGLMAEPVREELRPAVP